MNTLAVPIASLNLFPALFARSVSNPSSLGGVLPHNPTHPGQWETHLAHTATRFHESKRDALVRAITAMHQRIGTDTLTANHLRALTEPETFCVVTGQQPGLFGGPLYVLLKAADTITLARELAKQFPERKFVPLFWIASDDHDFAEIARTTVCHAGGVVTLSITESPPEGSRVGDHRVTLSSDLAPNDWRSFLSNAPHGDDARSLVDASEKSYAWSLTDGFAATLQTLFSGTGLLFLDPCDLWKENDGAFFRTLFQTRHDLEESLAQQTDQLADGGFPPVIEPHTRFRLFLLSEGRRVRLTEDLKSGSFRSADGSVVLSSQEIEALIEKSPERFSPDVAWRVLAQNALLPVAVQVAGPSEMGYIAQLARCHDDLDISMPAIVPRTTATFAPAPRCETVAIFLSGKSEPSPDENRMGKAIDALRDSVSKHLLEPLGDLARHLSPEMNRLEGGIAKTSAQIEKRTAMIQARTIAGTFSDLLPNTGLQERERSALWAVGRFGIKPLMRAVSLASASKEPGHVVTPVNIESETDSHE